MKNVNIVILGCGFSGMLTALALAKENIKTTIIESKDISNKSFFADIRSTVLTTRSKEFLEKLGLWCVIEPIVGLIMDVYVVDNKSPKMLHFDGKCVGNALGYMVKNSELKKALLSEVKKNKLINLIDKNHYSKIVSFDDKSVLYFKQEQTASLSCNLLIICDGANSLARQSFFINRIEKNYHQHALTFYIKHEKSHEGTALEHFMPSGPFAILPLKDPHSASIVWTVNEKHSSALKGLPSDEFEYILQQNCGNSLGKITLNSQIQAFPLKAYITKKYYHNKIVLVADSAHVIHPLAGQGLNQGIKDIEALSANTKSLANYQKLRQSDNFIMYRITDNLNGIFSNNSSLLHVLRTTGLYALDKIKPVKNFLVKYAMGDR